MKNHQKLNTSGFGAVVVVLLVVVVAAIAAAGLLVVTWHKTDTKPLTTLAKPAFVKAHLGSSCSDEAKTYIGKTVVGSNGKYRFCLPNGFSAFGSVSEKGGDYITMGDAENAKNPVYDPAKSAAFTAWVDQGKDGASTISVNFLPPSQNTSANESAYVPTTGNLTKLSAAQGANLTGTKFIRTNLPEAGPGEGLGMVPTGTVEYLYRFEQDKKLLVISYYKVPGITDLLPLVDAMVSTVALN